MRGSVLPFRPQALGTGDESEVLFAEFHARMYPRLYGYAFREVLDADVAADLAADVVAAVWMEHFRDGRTPATSVDALALRMMTLRISNLKRDDVRRAMKLNTYLEMWAGRAKNWMVPTEAYDHARRVEMLEDALRDVAPSLRRAFLMKHETGMSYKEIAAALGMSEHTVGNFVHRAALKLRACLERAGYKASLTDRRGRRKK